MVSNKNCGLAKDRKNMETGDKFHIESVARSNSQTAESLSKAIAYKPHIASQFPEIDRLNVADKNTCPVCLWKANIFIRFVNNNELRWMFAVVMHYLILHTHTHTRIFQRFQF